MYIWLDRLCLMQTSRDDKAWQIARMHNVYRLCEICIILPGGIQRLVGLDEETAWIHRAWTLQEVLLPKQAVVLYAWKLGSGSWEYPSPTECVVTEVIPEQSAVSPVVDVLEASIGSLCYGRFARGDDLWTRWPAIFRSTVSKGESTARAGLAQVISLLASLDLVDDDAREQAVWRCALMRTSSRPVDMVFSIMGLFGVELDARAFGKDDRLGATIALAQRILKKGGTSSWLAVSFYLAPCKQLSSFPEFPRTSVEGCAYVETDRGVREVAALVGGEYDVGWSLEGVPTGRMDDRGYLKLNAKAAPIVPTGQRQEGFKGGIDNMWAGKALVDIDGAVWRVVGESEESSLGPRRFAVFIGTQEAFPLRSQSRWHAGWGVRAILVEEHAPGRFHRTSCFMLGDVFNAVVDGWKTHAIAIGGPED
ncbi:uncharacterized protein LAESUDRAFT_722381 [Laetiporus sulphureus 93-53]|uniref:Heterokaryon incompatibility domain-containing protein n=1 Tax=Laetiporus sulphureus 93-53 TaxID=1314785 RepID=A0A165GDN7_9APHY|nr:uncharacterized protein LAESUDRAFT_722381 [Laetiporus sulphureus 93-53]KZT10203.1 hypothetical protein LAESUDRAFT_722381 [Laetiporus sulphureus 93-53]